MAVERIADLFARAMRVGPLAELPGRDRAICSTYRGLNALQMGAMGLRHGPLEMLRAMRRYPWLGSLMRLGSLEKVMTKHRTGRYCEANALVISNLLATVIELLGGLLGRSDRLVLHEDLVPPEILGGLGLEPWMTELLGIALPMIDPAGMEPYIDAAENAGVPADVCSLPKSTVGLVMEGRLPRPAAIVTSNMPCDGGMSQYALIERALAAPTFRLDVPYDFYQPRAVDYFAGELRRLIAWLEEHTPGRMDWDRMREICRERNRTVAAELELWELIRHRPAPMAAEPVYLAHLMWGIARPGSPRGTRVFRRIVELARANLAEGIAALEGERYRAALWNPPTLIAIDLFAWAERAYGVALIMDMLTYHRHPFIDTKSPDTMLRGLAQVIMQGPMARHTRGPARSVVTSPRSSSRCAVARRRPESGSRPST